MLERYANDGYSFLLQVFNNPDFLEQVSGLAELQKDIPAVEVIDCHVLSVSLFTF